MYNIKQSYKIIKGLFLDRKICERCNNRKSYISYSSKCSWPKPSGSNIYNKSYKNNNPVRFESKPFSFNYFKNKNHNLTFVKLKTNKYVNNNIKEYRIFIYCLKCNSGNRLFIKNFYNIK